MTTEELIVAADEAHSFVEETSLLVYAQPEVKALKATKPKKTRNPCAHPPYIDMITEAIVTLKEKNGSSQYAISKYIEDKHKQLSSNFKKMLLVQLKRLVASGKLVKVKGSFKVPVAPPAKKSLKTKAKSVEKKKVAVKTKAVATKPKLEDPKSKVTVTKSEVVAKPKPKAKPDAKPKSLKAKPTAKTKVASDKTKTTVKPPKAARTSTRTSPGKSTTPYPKKASTKKVAIAKTVQTKIAKSPVKKTVTRRGKK